MNDRPAELPTSPGISIGAMSKATGIPANTLRTWERRYDFPRPRRTESGQRLYDPTLIDHLRLVATALDAGHRPSQVLGLDRGQLTRLLGHVEQIRPPGPAGDGATIVDRWMDAVRNLDGRTLDAGFRSEAARIGLLAFLKDRAAPLMVKLGEGWRAGSIQVFQEHWASERLRSFLAEHWQPLSASASGPGCVAAALPRDRHDLGLHMACTVAAMCGWQIVFLGRDTPVDEIAQAVVTRDGAAALVSISSWTDPHEAHAHLEQLRARLHPDIHVVVGGAGSPGALPGITHLDSLDALYAWLSNPES